MKNAVKKKSLELSDTLIKKERISRKGGLTSFKGWKPVYNDLKKRTRKNRQWIREWEERPKSWLRRIRHWEKKVKSWEDYKASPTEKSLDSFLGRKEGLSEDSQDRYIPYYLRRKFYKRPTDPISLGYHEKCFNRGLKRLRKYNKIPYWLKRKKVETSEENLSKTFSKKDSIFEFTPPPVC